MIILSYGQIVAEGTMNDLQKMFINKTVFELVSSATRIEIHRSIRQIDPNCEFLYDDPVEISHRCRYTFSTSEGDSKAEEILRNLIQNIDLKISEFQISRPDLETIFLRATKKNWEKQDFLGRRKKSSQKIAINLTK